jgi:hypothetical protein
VRYPLAALTQKSSCTRCKSMYGSKGDARAAAKNAVNRPQSGKGPDARSSTIFGRQAQPWRRVGRSCAASTCFGRYKWKKKRPQRKPL